MLQNFSYLETMLERAEELSRAELAVLLEDAIDIHDRHWKIHWMLNFAQFFGHPAAGGRPWSGSAVMFDEEPARPTCRTLPPTGTGIRFEGLWRMKEAIKKDPALASAFPRRGRRGRFSKHSRAAISAAAFLKEHLEPYQREFRLAGGVWSHEFIFPTFREQPEADSRADTWLPGQRLRLSERSSRPSARTWRRASEELLAGLTGSERD